MARGGASTTVYYTKEDAQRLEALGLPTEVFAPESYRNGRATSERIPSPDLVRQRIEELKKAGKVKSDFDTDKFVKSYGDTSSYWFESSRVKGTLDAFEKPAEAKPTTDKPTTDKPTTDKPADAKKYYTAGEVKEALRKADKSDPIYQVITKKLEAEFDARLAKIRQANDGVLPPGLPQAVTDKETYVREGVRRQFDQVALLPESTPSKVERSDAPADKAPIGDGRKDKDRSVGDTGKPTAVVGDTGKPTAVVAKPKLKTAYKSMADEADLAAQGKLGAGITAKLDGKRMAQAHAQALGLSNAHLTPEEKKAFQKFALDTILGTEGGEAKLKERLKAAGVKDPDAAIAGFTDGKFDTATRVAAKILSETARSLGTHKDRDKAPEIIGTKVLAAVRKQTAPAMSGPR